VAPAAVRVSRTYEVTGFGATTCAPADGSGFRFRCETTGPVSAYSGSLSGKSTAAFEQTIDCRSGRTYGHGDETLSGSWSAGAQGAFAGLRGTLGSTAAAYDGVLR
jgi:hypothetical protein